MVQKGEDLPERSSRLFTVVCKGCGCLLLTVERIRDPEAGDPIQYDQLRIEHDQGAVEIVVYNRALLLFMTDSEAVRRMSDRRIRLIDLRGR